MDFIDYLIAKRDWEADRPSEADQDIYGNWPDDEGYVGPCGLV